MTQIEHRRHLITLDDLRINTRPAKYLHEELELVTRIAFHSDILCAPAPVEAWCSKHDILNYESLKIYLSSLYKPVILLDWQMPIPDTLRDNTPNTNGLKGNGLYLFYLINQRIEINDCYIWTQFSFEDAETDTLAGYRDCFQAQDYENYIRLVRSKWLRKGLTTGRQLAEKLDL